MFQVDKSIPGWLAIYQQEHRGRKHYTRLPNRGDIIVCQSGEGKKSTFKFRQESISQLVEIYRSDKDAYVMGQGELTDKHVISGELHSNVNTIIAICHQLEGKDYQ